MNTSAELHWLPPHPDFRAGLLAAKNCLAADPAAGLDRVSCVANHRLDFMQTLQLDRLLTSRVEIERSQWGEARIALLGSATVDHLLPAIRVAGARRKIRVTPYVSGFGQHRQELMMPNSGLYAFRPDFILLGLDAREFIGEIPLGAAEDQVAQAITRAIQGLKDLWRLARTQLHAVVIQQTLVHPGFPVFGGLDGAVPGTPRALVSRFNAALRIAAAEESVLLLDLDPWIESQGRDVWLDRVRWYHAKQLIAPTAAVFYGDLVARLIAASRGQSSKCLVLDLDNTIWGGVIGDDGIDGIVLGEGSGPGEAFAAFQRYAQLLGQRGVILAVCSKNDLDVAQAAFRDHPEMVLSTDDIAVFVANWNDKPSNLREIASRLNIGLDSLVFFDDNPAEREIVRQNLPEVAVPEVPADCADYVRCLGEAGYFEAVVFTDEDRARGRQYLANAERQAASGGSTDLDGFLASLQMKLTMSSFTDTDMPRIVQLTGKTNQFNLTTRRHGREQMEAFAGDPNVLTFSFRLSDKFGDNGLISVLIAVPDGAGRLRIDTWLMSCRVLGRQVEEEIVNQLVRAADALGVKTLVGEYIPTAKNGMVKDLYARMGFEAASGPGDDGRTLWTLNLSDYNSRNTHIEMQEPGAPARDVIVLTAE